MGDRLARRGVHVERPTHAADGKVRVEVSVFCRWVEFFIARGLVRSGCSGERERPGGEEGRERTTPLSAEDGQPPTSLAVVRNCHVRRAKLVGRQRTVVLERALVDVPDCFTTYQDKEKGVSALSVLLQRKGSTEEKEGEKGTEPRRWSS